MGWAGAFLPLPELFPIRVRNPPGVRYGAIFPVRAGWTNAARLVQDDPPARVRLSFRKVAEASGDERGCVPAEHSGPRVRYGAVSALARSAPRSRPGSEPRAVGTAGSRLG